MKQKGRTPRIVSITGEARATDRFQKLDVTFELDRTFPPDSHLPYYFFDPSDPVGKHAVSVDAEFETPSGGRVTVPAFYYVEQKRRRDWRGITRIEPTGRLAWKLRFAPQEVGTYKYRLVVRDQFGETRYPQDAELTFECVPSDAKGFVRVSPRDSRFFEFDDGSGFVPISAGQQWWDPRAGLRSHQYDSAFAVFGAHGINFTRVWDQCDGWALTVEGPFDGYGKRNATSANQVTGNPRGYKSQLAGQKRGTQMNPRSNFEEDLIVLAAERNGVYLQLCSVADPKGIWDVSVDAADAGARPVAFDDPRHLNYWKRNFRYRVARWGYSTAIAAWETWNEHGTVGPDSDIYRFYQAYGEYQRATDPYAHLRTTSQAAGVWSPALWASPAMDAANYHGLMPSRHDDETAHDAARFIYRTAQYLRMPEPPPGIFEGGGEGWDPAHKPIVWGKWDIGTARENEPPPPPSATHAAMWAGLFSPLGMSPVDWYQEAQPHPQQKYTEAKIAAAFFRDVDYAGARFEYLCTADVRVTSEVLQGTEPNLRVLAMRERAGRRASRAAYAWVQHRATRRDDAADSGAPLEAAFLLTGMQRGAYEVEWWDTYAGGVERGAAETDAAGNLTIPVRALTRDVAVKVRRTGTG
jgi:hypothetical protein